MSCVWAILCGFAPLAHADPPTVYQVGAARVDVTPDYPIRLNGFGFRRAESDGIGTRIHARALAISTEDSSPLVLIAVDSLGLRRPLTDRVAAALHRDFKIPRENVAITFTHSHCTPKVNGASDNIFSQPIPADQQARIDRYTRELEAGLLSAARAAIRAREPATLHWSVGTAGFAINRRTRGGPVDHDLPVLFARSRKNGRVLAVYTSYACHCVTLSYNLINGDWAGYAASMIERQFPDSVALVSIGAGSDQNPASGVSGDKEAVAEGQGVAIAAQVEQLSRQSLRPVSGSPQAQLATVALALNAPPTPEQLTQQSSQDNAAGYNARTQLQRLSRGESLQTQIDYTIQTWTLGDSLCIVFLAGEVCVDYSLRLKRELNRQRVWINAYSNDFCSYIPSERLVREGGYGGGAEIPYFALPATLKPGLEDRIVSEVHRQVPDRFRPPPGTQGVAPRSPIESLQCVRTQPGLKVVLAASEPLVTDPVAIDFGPDGRLWVCEMNDYGNGVDAQFPQTGRVRWLRDTDGDGVFDEAQTFADKLRYPTDVKVWRNGVLICDAPDILFVRDDDGDGIADRTETLFSGFAVHNAQARVNSLRFALDNTLHGACGLFGGTIRSHRTGATTLLAGQDFRCDPDTGLLEPLAGRTQQGRARNDWGDWFGCDNSTLALHFPFNDRYFRRNRLVPTPAASVAIAATPESTRLEPPGELVRFRLSGPTGRATSACGLGVYRDTSLGPQYRGDLFTCEPVHQLVHRLKPHRRGATFNAVRPADQRGEFLTSTDQWFRPVQARTGPDGALWIVDMYRYVIEHPRWIPQETLQELDVFAGQGRGRIYRVVSEDTKSRLPDLHGLTNAELVDQFSSTNGPVRDLAQQLLLWRDATEIAPALRGRLSDDNPLAVVHALTTLDGLERLSAKDIATCLHSTDPTVIRTAARLSEPWLDESPALLRQLGGHISRARADVLLQIAASLGASRRNDAALLLAQLADQACDDAWLQAVLLSSLRPDHVETVLRAVADTTALPAHRHYGLLYLSARIGSADALQAALTWLAQDPAGADAMYALTSVMLAADQREDAKTVRVRGAARRYVRQQHQAALDLIRSRDVDDDQRLQALGLLGRRPGPFSETTLATTEEDQSTVAARPQRLEAIAALIVPQQTVNVQRNAIYALSRAGDSRAGDLLIERWKSCGPQLRTVLLDTLLMRPEWTNALLDAIERGDVRRLHLDATRRQRLTTSRDAAIRSRAARLFQEASTTREDVLQTYHTALELTPNPENGRALFRHHCAKCHRLEDHGFAVGPDLRALTDRSPRALLSAVLDPNQEVDARYLEWIAVRTDGRTVNGLLIDETSTTIRLRAADGREHALLRTDIEELVSSDRSLMPEGLEREVSPQQLADLLAYVARFEVPPRTFPGNSPAVVQANSTGQLRLRASVAEIRGGDIRFETPFGNIGYWHDEHDRVSWRVVVEQGGRFDVYLDFACAAESAGNKWRIDGLSTLISGTAESTRRWDRYVQQRVGSVELEAGEHTIGVRPNGPLRQGALFDLREVRFVPAGQPAGFE